MKKACIFSSSGHNGEIVDSLGLYVGPFECELNVEPFMLGYRDYDLYIIEADHRMPKRTFERLPPLVKMNPTRVYGVWTRGTWQRIQDYAPSCLAYANCVDCDRPDWIEKLLAALKRADRIKSGNRKRKG